MDHSIVKHYVSLVAILGLTAFGVTYLEWARQPEQVVIITIIAAIAGLGGYEVRQRANGK